MIYSSKVYEEEAPIERTGRSEAGPDEEGVVQPVGVVVQLVARPLEDLAGGNTGGTGLRRVFLNPSRNVLTSLPAVWAAGVTYPKSQDSS